MFFPTQAIVPLLAFTCLYFLSVFTDVFTSVFTNVFTERLYYFFTGDYSRFLRTINRAFYGRLIALFTDDYSRFLRAINRAFYGRSYYFFTCKNHRLYIKNTRSLCLERVYSTLSFKTRACTSTTTVRFYWERSLILPVANEKKDFQ
jgi:hypothetical protein